MFSLRRTLIYSSAVLNKVNFVSPWAAVLRKIAIVLYFSGNLFTMSAHSRTVICMISFYWCYFCLFSSLAYGQPRIAVFVGDEVRDADKNVFFHGNKSQDVEDLVSFVRLSPEDQFYNANEICSTLRNGTWAMVAITNPDISTQLQWYSQALRVPLIMISSHYRHVDLANFNGTLNASEQAYQLNLRPETMKAVINLATRMYNWENALYITDSSQKLDQALAMYFLYTKNGALQNFYLNFYLARDVARTVEYLTNLAVRENHRDWRLILDSPASNASDLISRILSSDILRNRQFHFVLAALDFEAANFGALQFGTSRLTCLTLIDRSSAVYNSSQASKPAFKTTSQFGLALDAIQYAVNAAKKAKSATFSVQSLDCMARPYNVWNDGDKMLKLIRETALDLVTGPLEFDKNGHRVNYEYNIVEVLRDGQISQVGTWNDTTGLKVTKDPGEEGKRKTFRAVTFYINQFLNAVPCNGTRGQKPIPQSEIPNLQAIVGKRLNVTGMCYEGYNVDLLDELQKQTGFKFIVHVAKNNEYGRVENGTWIGGVGEILRKTADLTVGDLSIISEREAVVDFTIPFMSDAYVVLMKREEQQKPRMFSFLDPFSWTLWLSLFLALMVTFLIIFIVGRLAPSEWHMPSKCDPSAGDGLVNEYTAEESLWLTIATLLQQGPNIAPRSVATKIAVAAWFAWAMIIGASYTANLAAFLTINRMTPDINTIEDLANQDKVHYGMDKPNTATMFFFKNSRQEIYKSMWSKMETRRWLCDHPEDCVQWVREKKYAYICPRSLVDFINSGRPCDTRTMGLPLFFDNYALAVLPGSPLRKNLSEALLKLNENGILKQLEDRWFTRELTDECKAVKEKDSKTDTNDLSSLGPNDLTGLFIVLAGGLCLALTVAICEYMCKGRRKFRAYGVSMDRVLYVMNRPSQRPQHGPPSAETDTDKESSGYGKNGITKGTARMTTGA